MTVATTWHPSKGPRTNTPVESRPLPRTDRFRSHAVGSRVIAVFGVLSILAAAWWVTNSKIFELRTADVVGNRHLSSAQVLRLAALTRGTNVFWFSSGSAERRLMASPWVESATISRTLPGDVTVTIRERFPVAIVSAASGRALLVASDGVALGPVRRSNALPLITVTSAVHNAGDRIDPHNPGLMVAASLSALIRIDVTSIDVAADGQITLWLNGGVQVIYGDGSDQAAKGQALGAVLGWAAKYGVHPSYVDVRAPDAPALLPVGSVSPRH